MIISKQTKTTVLKQIKKMMIKNSWYTADDLVWLKNKIVDDNYMINFRYLSNNNKKLSDNVFSFDLPAIVTCKNCKECKKTCYAIKNERLYKTTRQHRLFNLYITLIYIHGSIDEKNIVFNLLNTNLQKLKLYNMPIVRFHTSGDIFHDMYLKLILDIVTYNKNINFYTYTKTLDNKKIDLINNTYKNFNIVKSNININNKNYINFGDDIYINKLENNLKQNEMPYFICNYSRLDNTKTCMGSCKACLNCPHVLFHKH